MTVSLFVELSSNPHKKSIDIRIKLISGLLILFHCYICLAVLDDPHDPSGLMSYRKTWVSSCAQFITFKDKDPEISKEKR